MSVKYRIVNDLKVSLHRGYRFDSPGLVIFM